MSRKIGMAVIAAGGLLMLATTADLSAAQRRAWRRYQRFSPVSYNVCCPQPVYQQACCPQACCPPGQFTTTGYASSPQPLSDTQPHQPSPTPQYAQPEQYGSTYDGRQADVPPAPPADGGTYAESSSGRPPQLAQDQAGPQPRTALRPNLEDSEQFQQMQDEIDSLKKQVSELRSDLNQLQNRRPVPEAEPAAPNEEAGSAVPETPQEGRRQPASDETDAQSGTES